MRRISTPFAVSAVFMALARRWMAPPRALISASLRSSMLATLGRVARRRMWPPSSLEMWQEPTYASKRCSGSKNPIVFTRNNHLLSWGIWRILYQHNGICQLVEVIVLRNYPSTLYVAVFASVKA